MDKTTRLNIVNKIQELEQIKIYEVIGEIFKEHDNIEQLTIDQMSIEEFTNLYRRTITQLKDEFENGNWVLLPDQYNFNNEFGSGSLVSQLSALATDINSVQLSSLKTAEMRVKTIAYYEIVNGFYDKSNRKLHDLRGIRVTDTENRLNLMIEHFNINLENKEKLFSVLDSKNKEISELIVQKKEELRQISINVETSNKDTQNIASLLNSSTESSTKIEALFEKLESLHTDAIEYIANENERFLSLRDITETLIKELDEQKQQFSNQILKHNEHLEFVESKTEYFKDRNNYLDELIGREVGASLFETFKQRKIELEKSVVFWRWAVPIMSVITVIGLVAVFSDFFTNWQPNVGDWQILLMKSLKSIPFIVILYFTIVQYSKERNFQEEYAFKSACALTIKAYADIIKDEISKDKLILEGVLNVYKTPIREKDRDKHEKLDKTILEMGKDITESVKNFASK